MYNFLCKNLVFNFQSFLSSIIGLYRQLLKKKIKIVFKYLVAYELKILYNSKLVKNEFVLFNRKCVKTKLKIHNFTFKNI